MSKEPYKLPDCVKAFEELNEFNGYFSRDFDRCVLSVGVTISTIRQDILINDNQDAVKLERMNHIEDFVKAADQVNARNWKLEMLLKRSIVERDKLIREIQKLKSNKL